MAIQCIGKILQIQVKEGSKFFPYGWHKLAGKCLKFGLIVSVCGFVGPEYADVVFL